MTCKQVSILSETLVLDTSEGMAVFETTRTVVTHYGLGGVYDPDDGLPLSFEGETLYGDGRLFNGHR